MKNFNFEWYKKENYGEPVIRKNLVTVSANISDTASAAKAATELFVKAFGSLKKNEIVSIQEVNEKGEPIGEVITPMEGSAIVPTRRG